MLANRVRMATFKDKGFIDTSGSPGNNTIIIGNGEAGYFGEVTASEFWNGIELASAVSLTAGTSHNDNAGWLKFVLNNKVIFVSKKTYKYNLNWDTLNEVGVANGKNVSKNGIVYKVRLLEGMDSNDSTKETEWNKIMLPIHIDAKTQNWDSSLVSIPTEYWGTDFTNEDLGISFGEYGGRSLTNGKYSGFITARGGKGIESWNLALSINTNLGWRPALEVI